MEFEEAEDYKVSGIFLLGYLSGVRSATGPHYHQLLKTGGLEKYADQNPKATYETATTALSIIKINHAVLKLIGPDLYNLFQGNVGREFGRTAANFPELKKEVAGVGPVKGPEQLRQVIAIILHLTQKSIGGRAELTAYTGDEAVNFVYRNCIYCAGREKTVKPTCPGIPAFYKEILYDLTGLRFQVTETRCGAMHGERDCHFQIKTGY